jgi:catechol 2,3-dioxygenase
MPDNTSAAAVARTPVGLNHLVLNVRDIEASHRFWTELLGFRQTGAVRPARPGEPSRFRFYSGVRDGRLHHHDLALAEIGADVRAPAQALNHVAVEYADRASWEAQVAFLRARGVALHDPVERVATHSIHLRDPDGNLVELVFELPREQWEGDIDAALNTRRPPRPAG